PPPRPVHFHRTHFERMQRLPAAPHLAAPPPRVAPDPVPRWNGRNPPQDRNGRVWADGDRGPRGGWRQEERANDPPTRAAPWQRREADAPGQPAWQRGRDEGRGGWRRPMPDGQEPPSAVTAAGSPGLRADQRDTRTWGADGRAESRGWRRDGEAAYDGRRRAASAADGAADSRARARGSFRDGRGRSAPAPAPAPAPVPAIAPAPAPYAVPVTAATAAPAPAPAGVATAPRAARLPQAEYRQSQAPARSVRDNQTMRSDRGAPSRGGEQSRGWQRPSHGEAPRGGRQWDAGGRGPRTERAGRSYNQP
ncbi:MAG: hypothetical protein SNJ79_10585, partial [Sphingomonadaceae bacterium]